MIVDWSQRNDLYARSLRGGGGELGNLKTLTYGFTTFSQR
jgi:hypothetical protein